MDLTEETAMNLIEQIMLLNASIDHLADLLNNTTSNMCVARAIMPHEEPAPHTKAIKPIDYDVAMSTKKVEVPQKDGTIKEQKYLFVGRPEYDPTKPLPECFKHYGSDKCHDPNKCIHNKLCQEHPQSQHQDSQEDSPPQKNKAPKKISKREAEMIELGKDLRILK